MANRNSPGSLLLCGANIVLCNQVLSDGSILIKDGCIAAVNRSSAAYTATSDQTLNLSNLNLFPGFIDIHIHGAVGVDTMTADKNGLLKVSRFLWENGVTAWVPTLVPAADGEYERAVRAIELTMLEQARQQMPTGAQVLGVHYEGPFVNALQCGALHSSHFKSYSGSSDIEALPTPSVLGAVRLMTLAPEVEGGIDLIHELVSRGWIVALGHTRAEIDQLEQAFTAGARHLTHFMNAMPPLHHRTPGPVGWGLSKTEVTFDLIADGIHLDPFTLKLLLKVKGPDQMTLISDAIAAAGAGNGDYKIWGETISVKNGRTSNAKGSIAGSVITMLDAVRMMLSRGASEVDVARMASANPARLLGLEQDLGAIEVGKRADLVVLDQQGNVKFTMIGGQILDARWQMLDVRC